MSKVRAEFYNNLIDRILDSKLEAETRLEEELVEKIFFFFFSVVERQGGFDVYILFTIHNSSNILYFIRSIFFSNKSIYWWVFAYWSITTTKYYVVNQRDKRR